MITLKKINSLAPRTRLRKISLILHQAALDLKYNRNIDSLYIKQIFLAGGGQDEKYSENPSVLEDLSQAILCTLGAEPADWDFTDEEGNLDKKHRVIQDKILILDRIRSPFNVGSVFRSADSFGIKKIILVEGTADPEHSRAVKTSRGCTSTVDWEKMSEDKVIEFLRESDCPIMALELGGENIDNFSFPSKGIAIIGSEEFGISPEILKESEIRLSIPMSGTKGSLNVSVATGILLEKWQSVF